MGDKVLQFEYSAWGPLVQAVRRTKGLVHDLREACEVVFSLPADNEAGFALPPPECVELCCILFEQYPDLKTVRLVKARPSPLPPGSRASSELLLNRNDVVKLTCMMGAEDTLVQAAQPWWRQGVLLRECTEVECAWSAPPRVRAPPQAPPPRLFPRRVTGVQLIPYMAPGADAGAPRLAAAASCMQDYLPAIWSARGLLALEVCSTPRATPQNARDLPPIAPPPVTPAFLSGLAAHFRCLTQLNISGVFTGVFKCSLLMGLPIKDLTLANNPPAEAVAAAQPPPADRHQEPQPPEQPLLPYPPGLSQPQDDLPPAAAEAQQPQRAPQAAVGAQVRPVPSGTPCRLSWVSIAKAAALLPLRKRRMRIAAPQSLQSVSSRSSHHHHHQQQQHAAAGNSGSWGGACAGGQDAADSAPSSKQGAWGDAKPSERGAAGADQPAATKWYTPRRQPQQQQQPPQQQAPPSDADTAVSRDQIPAHWPPVNGAASQQGGSAGQQAPSAPDLHALCDAISLLVDGPTVFFCDAMPPGLRQLWLQSFVILGTQPLLAHRPLGCLTLLRCTIAPGALLPACPPERPEPAGEEAWEDMEQPWGPSARAREAAEREHQQQRAGGDGGGDDLESGEEGEGGGQQQAEGEGGGQQQAEGEGEEGDGEGEEQCSGGLSVFRMRQCAMLDGSSMAQQLAGLPFHCPEVYDLLHDVYLEAPPLGAAPAAERPAASAPAARPLQPAAPPPGFAGRQPAAPAAAAAEPGAEADAAAAGGGLALAAPAAVCAPVSGLLATAAWGGALQLPRLCQLRQLRVLWVQLRNVSEVRALVAAVSHLVYLDELFINLHPMADDMPTMIEVLHELRFASCGRKLCVRLPQDQEVRPEYHQEWKQLKAKLQPRLEQLGHALRDDIPGIEYHVICS